MNTLEKVNQLQTIAGDLLRGQHEVSEALQRVMNNQNNLNKRLEVLELGEGAQMLREEISVVHHDLKSVRRRVISLEARQDPRTHNDVYGPITKPCDPSCDVTKSADMSGESKPDICADCAKRKICSMVWLVEECSIYVREGRPDAAEDDRVT